MSTAWQGKILAGTGSALFIASVAAYFAKSCDPMPPIVAMGISGLVLTLVGLVYTRKADEWAKNREDKSRAKNYGKFVDGLGKLTARMILAKEGLTPEERKMAERYLALADPQSPEPPKRGS